jgi:hypothetical protein
MGKLFFLSISLLVFLSVPIMGKAYAVTEVSWDRNAESDGVVSYELYVCSTLPTCSPFAGGVRLGVNIPQPPVIPPVLPMSIQRVVMAWPTNAPVMGRVSVVAVDGVGNKSVESNVVVFRGQPLNAPKGLSYK